MGDTGEGRAELSTRRMLLAGVAVSVVVAAVAALVVADPRGRAEPPAWLAGVIALAFVSLVVVGAAAPWLRPGRLRWGAATGVVLFFVALVSFAPASGAVTGTATGGTVPWALTSVGGFAVAAVVAGGARLGWSVVAAWAVLIVVLRVALGGYSMIGLANDAQALTSAAMLCAISVHALGSARALDEATSRAEVIWAAQGAERGRLAARARVAAFVHDEVLAALRGVAAGIPGTADAVRAQARRATSEIDADRDTGEWVERLRSMAVARSAAFQVQSVPQPVVPGPAAAEALLIAARQALENSLRHAGPCRRRMLLDVGAEGVAVRIVDDGVGFSPELAARGRLGIAASIEGTMRDVAGGQARVTSAPGKGTVVELTWDRSPAEDDASAIDSLGQVGAAGRPGVRAGAVVAVTLFVLTQATVAAVAASASASAADATSTLLVFAGILLAAALTLPRLPRSAARNAAAVVILAVTVLGGLLTTPAPLTYGSAWFIPAAGFVLVAVALNARPALAVGGALAVLTMLAVDAGVRGGDPVQLLSVGVRTATMVGLGTLLAVTIVRMQRAARSSALRAARAVEQGEWDAAARREIDAHAAAMDEFAGPLLTRVAAGEPLGDLDRSRARAIEGRLRDEYRAGRLQHAPLVDAAMRARSRGVDVVLLDDAGDTVLDAAAVERVAAWMCDQVEGSRERFVGRLVPAGRGILAQVVVDGTVRGFAE